MTVPDLLPSLIESMKASGVDVTTWSTKVYDRLKLEMSEPGTSIVQLQQPRCDGMKIGIQRRGAYVKVLGNLHVLYPENFTEHQGCESPTSFVMDHKNDKDIYDHATRFVHENFGIKVDPGLVYNWPPGFWPDIKIQETIEYPIPFTYEAWPVSAELLSDQFDPSQEMVSQIDGSKWHWVKRPPKQ